MLRNKKNIKVKKTDKLIANLIDNITSYTTDYEVERLKALIISKLDNY